MKSPELMLCEGRAAAFVTKLKERSLTAFLIPSPIMILDDRDLLET